MRLVARLVVAVGMLLGVTPVRAAVDLNGTFQVHVQSFIYGSGFDGTFTFTQVGTDLTLAYDINASGEGPLTGTLTGGTIDPDAGTFAFAFGDTPPASGVPGCTGNGLTGTASPESATISGTWVTQIIATMGAHAGCVNVFGSFVGARNPVCGDGLVLGGETCDDGNTVDGDCCSSTCQQDPAGTPCDDGNGCTSGDVCNVYGLCRPGAFACGACEACVGNACVTGPDAACEITSGSAALTVDLGHHRLTATARAPAQPLEWYFPALDEHALCVFSSDGSTWTPLASTAVPAGPPCPATGCWGGRGSRALYHSATGAPAGMQTLSLVTTAKANYKVTAGSPNLLLPAILAPTPGVRIQFRSKGLAGDVCYAADFTNVVPGSPMKLRLRRR